jgi:hypothetical protein
MNYALRFTVLQTVNICMAWMIADEQRLFVVTSRGAEFVS